jgi:hypothetical protein
MRDSAMTSLEVQPRRRADDDDEARIDDATIDLIEALIGRADVGPEDVTRVRDAAVLLIGAITGVPANAEDITRALTHALADAYWPNRIDAHIARASTRTSSQGARTSRCISA